MAGVRSYQGCEPVLVCRGRGGGICTESTEQAGEPPQRWRCVLKTRGMNAGFPPGWAGGTVQAGGKEEDQSEA